MVANIINANTIPLGGAISFSYFAPGMPIVPVIPIPNSLNITGTWTIMVKDLSNNCSSSKTLQVNVLIAPIISINSIEPFVCIGDSAKLYAIGANSFTWNQGATTTSVSVLSTLNATFGVVGTGSNTCANTATYILNAIPKPSIEVNSSKFSICLNEAINVSVSGANSYVWSTSATTSTVALAPKATTAYTVSGSTNGCKTSKVFTITVEPCTGISSTEGLKDQVKVYPNPIVDELKVSIKESADILIFDISGSIVYNNKLKEGVTIINTSEFQAGVYFIRISNNNGVWQGRVVK